jgi:hypothetical protein
MYTVFEGVVTPAVSKRAFDCAFLKFIAKYVALFVKNFVPVVNMSHNGVCGLLIIKPTRCTSFSNLYLG